jgi:hypothetical protein
MLLALLTLTLCGSPITDVLSDSERRAVIAKSTPEELERAMRETPVPLLIEMGAKAVDALGTYSYTMRKRERVKGTLHDEQEIVATIREKPFAARLEFIKGPGAGRRVLFNPSIRATDFRVKEPGVLSVLGGLWIGVDSSLAKKDSNHSVKEAGLGNLLRRFKKDHDRALPLGGFEVKHEGWDKKGNFCSMWISPNKGVGFDSAKSRICTDLKSGLPSKVESFDGAGEMIETYEFSNAKQVTLSDVFLKPEGM